MLWLLISMGLAVGPEDEGRAAADRATEYLAGALSEPTDAIRVVRVEAVRWSDASLGCPEPGREYARVVSDGHRVLLRVGRSLFTVHVAGERTVRCRGDVKLRRRDALPPSGGGVTGEVPDAVLAEVVADLAARRDADPADVELLASEAVTWRDGALGCPERGKLYTQALVPGYRVVLGLDGDEYDYRVSDRGRFRLCEMKLSREGLDRGPPAR